MPGIDGKNGKDGRDGAVGPIGLQGPLGVSGPRGKTSFIITRPIIQSGLSITLYKKELKNCNFSPLLYDEVISKQS